MADFVRSDLRAFYEAEAKERRRVLPSGRRVDLLADFVRRVETEGRCSVIDVGSGPASDAAAFEAAGVRYVGVDLAQENGVFARERGHHVMAASLFDLPFQDSTFDCAWSMSTLMHVPETEMDAAMTEVVRVLRPGAIYGVGVWGGGLGDIVSDHAGTAGQRRLFSLRTAERNVELVERHGSVEHHEIWDAGPDGWNYQFAMLRIDS